MYNQAVRYRIELSLQPSGNSTHPVLQHQVLYWALVIDSALFLGSHTVWNQPSLSVRSYVWLPKKSLWAWTKLAGSLARLMLSK